MMEMFRVPEQFITLIMDCVQTVQYSILIQGVPFGKIVPSRGLRQGDPISSYLFLLVAEGFSSLFLSAERKKLIHGVSIARGAPSISHLFFVDNSLLFCDATVLGCSNLKEVFRIYEETSGQKINIDKSAVCFSPRTRGSVKDDCGNALNMAIVLCHERYLGLPTMTGKDKKSLFRGLSDRIWKRVNE